MRAVKKSKNISAIDPDPTITMYGYSGGGVTAAWVSGCVFDPRPVQMKMLISSKATEMQPSYAPDVQIAGAVLGGLIPNISLAFGTRCIQCPLLR
jgi:hypothetical protein